MLTLDFIDEVGHPTREALDDLIQYFDSQLNPSKRYPVSLRLTLVNPPPSASRRRQQPCLNISLNFFSCLSFSTTSNSTRDQGITGETKQVTYQQETICEGLRFTVSVYV